MFQQISTATLSNQFTKRIKLALLATLACFIASSSAHAQSSMKKAQKTTGVKWPTAQQISIDSVNHKSFDQLLKKYVNKDGQVNYKAWHANPTDRKALTDYQAHLSQANHTIPAQRNAQLAYWTNAYNAVTIEGIMRVYPTDSIRKHTGKLGGYNVWKDLNLIVGDSQINLEDIEHKVLRKMNEPRIHFAIVCASVGCPRLLVNTKDFFSRSQNLQVDPNSRTVKLSKIMEWYGTDFGADTGTQIAVLKKYWPAASMQAIAAGGYSVSYLPYDWGLNTQK